MGPILVIGLIIYIIQILIPFIGIMVVGFEKVLKDMKIRSRWGLIAWLLIPGYPLTIIFARAWNHLKAVEERAAKEKEEK